jgi:MscS family membrane protein
LLTDGSDKLTSMGVTVLRRMIRVAVVVLLALFLLQNLFNANLTALLGGFGLAALAVSLAAQDVVKNLFGGLMVFANRPFVVGDWIAFKNILGEVEDVSLQVTRVRLLSGELWSVPNKHFTDDPVENLSLRRYIRREMNIAVTYHTPPKKVAQALGLVDEVLRDDEVVDEGQFDLENRAPVISFSGFGPHYLNIKVYYWYFISPGGGSTQRNASRGWFSYLNHCTLVNHKILAAFNEHEIDFAFPTQSLELMNAEGEEVAIRMDAMPQGGDERGNGEVRPDATGRQQASPRAKQPAGGEGQAGDGESN